MTKIRVCEKHIVEIGRANSKLIKDSEECAVCYMEKILQKSKELGELTPEKYLRTLKKP